MRGKDLQVRAILSGVFEFLDLAKNGAAIDLKMPGKFGHGAVALHARLDDRAFQFLHDGLVLLAVDVEVSLE